MKNIDQHKIIICNRNADMTKTQDINSPLPTNKWHIRIQFTEQNMSNYNIHNYILICIYCHDKFFNFINRLILFIHIISPYLQIALDWLGSSELWPLIFQGFHALLVPECEHQVRWGVTTFFPPLQHLSAWVEGQYADAESTMNRQKMLFEQEIDRKMSFEQQQKTNKNRHTENCHLNKKR